MEIHHSQFSCSYAKVDDCPDSKLPEYAFIGRSNVGKSSLINALTNRKDLARVSGTPGKTQLINFFLIDETWNLVDLPGYGYAKVSKKDRKGFSKMIRDYLEKRMELACVFVLVDGSISPQKIDLDFIDWLGAKEIPFVIIMTKADKAKQREVMQNKKDLEKELMKHWEEVPAIFLSSAEKGTGLQAIKDFIGEVNESLNEPDN